MNVDIQLAQGGDTAAFCRLVERYRNAATAVALGFVRDVAWSEDVAQEAFVQAWRGLAKLRNAESFGPWLLQLVRRQALQALRGEKRSRQRNQAWSALTQPEAEDLEEAEARVREALDLLPEDAREVLLLFYREEQSTRQVAVLLELSEGAVRKRLERARETLRERFDALGDAVKKTAPPIAFVLAVLARVDAEAAGAAATQVVRVAADRSFWTAATKPLRMATLAFAALVVVAALLYRPTREVTPAKTSTVAAPIDKARWWATPLKAPTAPTLATASASGSAASVRVGSAEIRGRVHDAVGHPIAGALLDLSLNFRDADRGQSTSDANGFFSFGPGGRIL